MGSMALSSPIYTARIWKTQSFDLESRSPIVNESNQTNVKMMEKVQVSTSSRDIWGSGGLAPRKIFLKATLSRMSENALLRSRKSCLYHWFSSWDGKYDTTLQSVCTNLKKFKTLIFKEEIF